MRRASRNGESSDLGGPRRRWFWHVTLPRRVLSLVCSLSDALHHILYLIGSSPEVVDQKAQSGCKVPMKGGERWKDVGVEV